MMSESKLSSAETTLYKLSREVSRQGFQTAIREKGGIPAGFFYVMPLDKQPYCAIVRRLVGRQEIKLGKYGARFQLGSIFYLTSESQEVISMQQDLIGWAYGFIDYLRTNKQRFLRLSKPERIVENSAESKASGNALLRLINGRNLTEILDKGVFKGNDKKVLLETIDKLQEDGVVTTKKGKFKVKFHK